MTVSLIKQKIEALLVFTSSIMSSEVNNLVEKLREANEAYRNNMPLLMTDDEYDKGLERLQQLDSKHSFLKQIRAKPKGSHTITMPYYLGSLDKVRTEEELKKWIVKHEGPYILSEKLDGISALLNLGTQQLYLSGDEMSGLDVSKWLQYMKLPKSKVPTSMWIRGELLLPNSKIPEGKLGRSIVNGIFHHLQPNRTDVEKVDFLGYEIIGPHMNLSTEEQLQQLAKWKISIPWYTRVGSLSADSLHSILEKQRQISQYEMDGIVIKTNIPSEVRVTKGNPKDAVAWKPPTGETKITTVVRVEWNASAVGRLTPRVEIEPIQLGGSTITYVTGVNARRIQDWKIGTGAKVIIRKGGDVIPVIVSVEYPGTVSFPPESTWVWETEEKINIRLKEKDTKTIAAQLTKMARLLEWDTIGPAQMDTLVTAGYHTVPQLLQGTEKEFQSLLGPIKGSRFFQTLRDGWSGKNEITLFLASPLQYTGVAASKLEALLHVEKDVTKWATLKIDHVKGWSPDSVKQFQAVWKQYEHFRKTEWSFLKYPQMTKLVEPTKGVTIKGTIVFSGFRNATLEDLLLKKGYLVIDAVRSDTKALLVKDTEDPHTYTSTKVEKAKKIPGCIILRQKDISRLP